MPNQQIIAPATGAQSVMFNATECDSVLIAACGVALSGGDAVTIAVVNSTNGSTPIYDAAGVPIALSAAIQSVLLEGGMTYLISKGVTAGASGIDANIKPRIGP